MCYKISNTAGKEEIEDVFNATFKFPKLHEKTPVIDGLVESPISIIKMSNREEITLAIWGLLPETFQDDWQYFQNVQNTLNVDLKGIEEDPKYENALQERRCLIIATGFFTYYLHEGNLYPYYVHLPSNEPFAIAGVYNELDDGFVTCSIVVSKANEFIKEIHNSDTSMPVVLNTFNQDMWLDANTSQELIETIVETTSELSFHAHTIAKEFHKLGVDFDSVLEPVSYKNVPKTK
ncbi:SOS response-associated peptidase [Kordia jejudonensis]|uniref:SOS response-associated peptidase n=1 Tax=Kordia jejudonensis TaxID=1348245 RepID=UPI0006294420|nr:SOS response-associated peptidase family protein [Kordia jejudonensis]